MAFIAEIETALGLEARKDFLPMQQGDVLATMGGRGPSRAADGLQAPRTPLSEGIPRFVEWYRAYQGRNRVE